MARKSLRVLDRQARTNDSVHLVRERAKHYSSRYRNRIGVVTRVKTDKKNNTKICFVTFPNRVTEMEINQQDLVVVTEK